MRGNETRTRRPIVVSGLVSVAVLLGVALVAAVNGEADPYGLTCKSDARSLGTYDFVDEKEGVAATPADAVVLAQMWKAFSIPEEAWRVVEDRAAALPSGGLVLFEENEPAIDSHISSPVTHVYKAFDPGGASRLAVLVSRVGEGYRVEGYVAC